MMSGSSSTVFSIASMPLVGLGDAIPGELQVGRVHLPRVLVVLDDEHERLVARVHGLHVIGASPSRAAAA